MSEETTEPYLTRKDLGVINADDRKEPDHSFNNSFSDRFFLGEIIDMEIKKTGVAVCGMSFLSALHSRGYAVVLTERALQ
ncbi:MAG: hypothetical protein H8E10_10655 [Desulfobacterales bacterium]|nr:hypothetical protein [Desulfobacterales bacterium]